MQQPETVAIVREARPPNKKRVFEQRRKDKALLNTYSNEKEIDLGA